MKFIKHYFEEKTDITIIPLLMLVCTVGILSMLGICFLCYGYINIPLTVVTAMAVLSSIVYIWKEKKWISIIQPIFPIAIFILIFTTHYDEVVVNSLPSGLTIMCLFYMFIAFFEVKRSYTEYSHYIDDKCECENFEIKK